MQSELTVCNGVLYFVGPDGTNGNKLWSTDGTDAGTAMVTSRVTARGHRGSETNGAYWVETTGLMELTVLNDKLFFNGDDGTHGVEMWVTDGTDAGTTMAKDINPVAGSGSIQLTVRVHVARRACHIAKHEHTTQPRP